MNIIGLILYFSFYISFYIKMFVQGSHGIKTIQIGRGHKPKKTGIIEVSLVIMLLITALTQFLTILFDEKLPIIIKHDGVRYFGAILSVAGIIVLIVAMATLGDSWRGGIDYKQKTELITTGIYKYSRNPGFVGFDLFFIGMALLFSNLFNVIFSCMLLVLLHLQILEEEKFLAKAFGKEYSDYQKKTRRYF
ncbi:methyltransferase family protein [Trichococcus shcherbakoviae]|uniref:Isoprenylcysteine carboxylmethyltransferase family protein n=1 Tax=Trichococcus shcherbakoviae subsp. psychrophilus TaxID=2585775 RepID=A0A5C5E7Y7_9LACT|nr:isoprenylcysteine carboxylmethyltransferase family protein [Trichococcus shcherbakoviae]TNV68670.1 isoprenylcysteine carboxylmethyltransferase family protein [Trichococcus shcherbakoviae subsp. psychrophilus]